MVNLLSLSLYLFISRALPYSPHALISGYVDDIIAPRDTRKRLIGDLEMLKGKQLSNPKRKHGNIPL